jgi:hypothetical protein
MSYYTRTCDQTNHCKCRYVDGIPQPKAKAVAAAGAAEGSGESATKKRQVSEVVGPPKTVEEAMAGLKERFPVWM